MELTIRRYVFSKDGIFSELYDENGMKLSSTLEHSYMTGKMGFWRPKIPNGVFVCVRGMHQLAGMTAPFETFEITGVEGHTNLLFHAGNFNHDSEGCILLGQNHVGNMVTNSRETFQEFMELQAGLECFNLTVT